VIAAVEGEIADDSDAEGVMLDLVVCSMPSTRSEVAARTPYYRSGCISVTVPDS